MHHLPMRHCLSIIRFFLHWVSADWLTILLQIFQKFDMPKCEFGFLPFNFLLQSYSLHWEAKARGQKMKQALLLVGCCKMAAFCDSLLYSHKVWPNLGTILKCVFCKKLLLCERNCDQLSTFFHFVITFGLVQ